MSVADLHDLELVWPSLGPTDVIVTGTFDQWSASIHLAKGDAGFSVTVKVPWGEKVAYKFIVDGRWRCRDDRPKENDGHGNINNVLLTPDKPLLPVHEPPARLSIPLMPDGYGDLEHMVTAVEFLPLAEPAKGSAPRISLDSLGQAPSVDESKLDTAGATEGHISPTTETPAKLVPLQEASSSRDVATLATNDKVPASIPAVSGTREAHEPHSLSGHEVADAEPPSSSLVPVTGKEAVLESVSQPSSQAIQDGPPLANRVDELTGKHSQLDFVETATQPSTVASSTPTHKKRRSLFARIKHIFERDKDKQGKEKNNH